MELIVLFSFLLIFTYVVVKKFLSHNHSSDPLNLIPGPKKLPVIGNLHLLVVGKSPPHHLFRDLAIKYGALMRLQLGEIPFVIVSSAEAAKQVLKNHDIAFANRIPSPAAALLSYNYSDLVTAPYGDHWRRLKKICTLEVLSSRRVKSFRPIREEEILSLARWIVSNEGLPTNLSKGLHLTSLDIIARSAVGNNINERREITSLIDEIMTMGSGLNIIDLYPSIRFLRVISGMRSKVERIFRRTDRILQSVVDRHRVAAAATTDERSEDLVDVLLEYQRQEAELHLTTDTIKAVILNMFIAGSDTSATVVSWAMSEMIRNPRTLQSAQDEVRHIFDVKGYVDEARFEELKYLKLVIWETLRLHPALPFLIPRMSSERCEINGYEIPAKTRVIINASALARDSKHWNEAEKFIPERFVESPSDYKGNSFDYMPFGSGRRVCPGIHFGLANVEFMLAILVYHFDWKMPKSEQLDMTEALGATARRKRDLVLIPSVQRPLLQLQ